MQISIYKTFGIIKSLNLLILLVVTLLSITIISEYASFKKLQNLQNEKMLATTVYKLGRDDLDLSNIQFRGKNTMLRHESNTLSSFYEYDYISQFSQVGNYQNELTKLQGAVSDFNVAAGDWYTQENVTDEELHSYKLLFTERYNLLIAQIDSMLAHNVLYEAKRFNLQLGLIFAIFLLALYSILWSGRQLSKIQGDLRGLTTQDQDETAEFATVEAESISKHTSRSPKASVAVNPAYLDNISGINSLKGFMHEFGEKKNQKLGNYTAICIFSIDKLTELEMGYSQDFSEALIKKVGFMLSLYRQHNDIIGRLDHNQFAILLSRQDKTSAINDCELIRKSVEETSFNNSDGSSVNVTLSGGFVQKTSTQNLTDVTAKANKVLSMSIQHGGNRIAQLRDKASSLEATASLK